MSKGSKQRPTDKSKYDSTYDKIFKKKQKQALVEMIEWNENLHLYEVRHGSLAASIVEYMDNPEEIFKDPEREAFDAINKCSTLEEAQACLHSRKDGSKCELCNDMNE